MGFAILLTEQKQKLQRLQQEQADNIERFISLSNASDGLFKAASEKVAAIDSELKREKTIPTEPEVGKTELKSLPKDDEGANEAAVALDDELKSQNVPYTPESDVTLDGMHFFSIICNIYIRISSCRTKAANSNPGGREGS